MALLKKNKCPQLPWYFCRVFEKKIKKNVCIKNRYTHIHCIENGHPCLGQSRYEQIHVSLSLFLTQLTFAFPNIKCNPVHFCQGFHFFKCFTGVQFFFEKNLYPSPAVVDFSSASSRLSPGLRDQRSRKTAVNTMFPLS